MTYVQDLCSFGSLCQRIRSSRNLSAEYIASHFAISNTTISRLENNERISRQRVEQYIAALQSPKAQPPLTCQQAKHLLQLYDLSHPKTTGELEEELAVISLADIKTAPSSSNEQLRELHKLFVSQKYPALLCDDLWFDHALNGALLELFLMHPQAKYMYDWKTWHSLATKLHVDSPLLKVHDPSDNLFVPTIQLFYDQAYRYLFTPQARHLIKVLSTLSNANKMQFDNGFTQVLTYAFTYTPALLINLKKEYPFSSDNQVQVRVRVQGTYPIKFEGGYTVNYHLMVWEPIPGHSYSQKRFDDLFRSGACQKIHYAVDYDKRNSFHVNTWPAVQKELNY